MKSFEEVASQAVASTSDTALAEIEARVAIEKGILRVAIQVRDARISRGFSQIELAEAAGITQGEISRIENGRFAPRVETLVKLSHALGTPFTIEAGGSASQAA